MQVNKKIKVTKESVVDDITDSILEINQTLKSIGEIHSSLVKFNQTIVDYLLTNDEQKKSKPSQIILTEEQIQNVALPTSEVNGNK